MTAGEGAADLLRLQQRPGQDAGQPVLPSRPPKTTKPPSHPLPLQELLEAKRGEQHRIFKDNNQRKTNGDSLSFIKKFLSWMVTIDY